jgi:hypothetical protein
MPFLHEPNAAADRAIQISARATAGNRVKEPLLFSHLKFEGKEKDRQEIYGACRGTSHVTMNARVAQL